MAAIMLQGSAIILHMYIMDDELFDQCIILRRVRIS